MHCHIRRTNSTAAWALLRDKVVAGRPPLLFVATHFKAGDNAESAEMRRQQANSLAKVIADLKNANPGVNSIDIFHVWALFGFFFWFFLSPF